MAYKIDISRSAHRALKKLDRDSAQRIADAIDELADEARPVGVKKLTDQKDLYRIRVGDYRIIFQIADQQLTVLVVTIGHRRDVYRGR